MAPPDTVSNQELVEKATITTDAIASAGKLQPAQADKFIDYVVEETKLRDQSRVVRFRNEQLDIDKIGVGARVAVPKSEASDPSIRRGITTSKISLRPQAIMVPFEISDEFREHNIEGEAVEDTIIKLMAKRLANNLEELFIGADPLGAAVIENEIRPGGSSTLVIRDSYMGLITGWLRAADAGHQVDAGGTPIGLGIFGSMIRALPTKFRRDRGNLRFYVPVDLEQLYIEKLSTRGTPLGDKMTEGGAHKPYGVEIVGVPLWQFQPLVVQHVTLTGTTPVALRYADISSVVVTAVDLAGNPTPAFVNVTDYVVVTSSTASTIARAGGGAIADGATVKVTYRTNPQIVLTHKSNFITGIGRDIRIEKARNIYQGVNQYAITAKVDVQFEEADAIVKAFNISRTI